MLRMYFLPLKKFSLFLSLCMVFLGEWKKSSTGELEVTLLQILWFF